MNNKKNFDIEEIKPIFDYLSKDIDIKKIEFSSTNSFSFNINKNLRFNNIKVESIVDLDHLLFNQKNFKIKAYFPSFIKEINLKKHKVVINYNKNKFNIDEMIDLQVDYYTIYHTK